MHRDTIETLKEWQKRPNRKPLIVRGARQVGKSYLVRMFGRECFESTVEINFETQAWAAQLFSSCKPSEITAFLETQYNRRIEPGKTLLFLDEIQAAPKALATLRYFYEELPDLHIIAAGSLLDFVLKEHKFSMPVGRIEYLHLGPMSFEEFLLATGNEIKLERLKEYSTAVRFDKILHESFMADLRKYLVIGGMPGCIQAYLERNSYLDVQRVQEGILATYQDDFSKYAGRIDHELLRRVFSRLPLTAGQKVKYSSIDSNERSNKISDAIEQLELAGLVTRVTHTDANGIPLGSELNRRDFKLLFLDVGLLCRACRLDMTDLLEADDLLLVNSGAVCEQFIGQHLLYNAPSYQKPELYCWMRQKAGTSSEVDYVIQLGTKIIPVEVKAGHTGRLKSLHVFLLEKQRDLALRFNADVPSVVDTETTVASRESKPFRLLSLPLYMAGQANKLIKDACNGSGN